MASLALLALLLLVATGTTSALEWSAGFSNYAVFQRSTDTPAQGVAVYGFAHGLSITLQIKMQASG